MKPWASANGLLKGYWWDSRKGRLQCRKNLGPRGFCSEFDLLTLNEHDEGPDVLAVCRTLGWISLRIAG